KPAADGAARGLVKDFSRRPALYSQDGTRHATCCIVIRLKRAREPAARGDGHRVLVDRLWPRGLRKADAHIDAWRKDVAPSTELRRWFSHDPRRFPEFRERYRQELRSEPARAALAELARRAARGTVTLVYAARDELHNNAVVLAQELSRRVTRVRAQRAVVSRARTRPA
ncbi:MAG TPA: DUF488 family protein, partial [Kofleriaceae bacterium]